jgi:hypothetical protein
MTAVIEEHTGGEILVRPCKCGYAVSQKEADELLYCTACDSMYTFVFNDKRLYVFDAFTHVLDVFLTGGIIANIYYKNMYTKYLLAFYIPYTVICLFIGFWSSRTYITYVKPTLFSKICFDMEAARLLTMLYYVMDMALGLQAKRLFDSDIIKRVLFVAVNVTLNMAIYIACFIPIVLFVYTYVSKNLSITIKGTVPLLVTIFLYTILLML